MHPVGELADIKAAQRIIQELQQASISCQLTTDEKESVHCIWVEREEDIPFALERFRVALGFGKPIEIDPEWERIGKVPMGQISLCLIIVSALVYICMKFIPSAESFVNEFFIATQAEGLLSEVRGGEIWRLLTPIFLHFTFLHILFNMMWIKDLGSLIEHAKGQKTFLFLILTSGILSNLSQYLVGGPAFGGMSGVVYACLGFIWMQKKFCKEFDYGLPKRDVIFMIVFFVACMTGIFGPIANMAHALGLSIGMLWGIFHRAHELNRDSFLYISLAIVFSGLAFGVEWLKRDGNLFISIFN